MTTVTRVKVFEVEAENKAGKLGEIARALATQNINIVGVQTIGSLNSIRITTNDPTKTETTLKSKNWKYKAVDVLGVRVPNKPGALADIAEKLGKSSINIESIIGYSSSPNIEGELLLRVPDVSQAEKVLQG